jgi:hypothetical protein
VIISKKTHGLSLTPFEKGLNRFPISKLVFLRQASGRTCRTSLCIYTVPGGVGDHQLSINRINGKPSF